MSCLLCVREGKTARNALYCIMCEMGGKHARGELICQRADGKKGVFHLLRESRLRHGGDARVPPTARVRRGGRVWAVISLHRCHFANDNNNGN